MKYQPDSHQDNTGHQQHRKGISHDPFRFLLIPGAPGNPAQRRRAAKQIGKRSYHHDDRKTEAQSAQRQLSHLGDHSYIYPVHDII